MEKRKTIKQYIKYIIIFLLLSSFLILIVEAESIENNLQTGNIDTDKGKEVSDIEFEKLEGDILSLRITVPIIKDTKYRIWVKDRGGWSLLLDEVSYEENSFIWTPKPTSNDQYSVYIIFTDKKTNETREQINKELVISYFSDFKINKISSENYQDGQTLVGSTEDVRFDCNRNDLEYQFFYNWNERGWLPLAYSYSQDAILSWTPKKAGKYRILACIRQKSNPQNYLETIIDYNVTDNNYIYHNLKDVKIDTKAKKNYCNSRYRRHE